MPSPLDISAAEAHRSLELARQRFEQAALNARIATVGACCLFAASFVAIGYAGLHVSFLLVPAAALLLAMASRHRVNKLERRLWWNQARSGLVLALAEQREQVIDLRDGAKASERVEL